MRTYPNLTCKTRRLHKRIWQDKGCDRYWTQIKHTVKQRRWVNEEA